MQTTDRDFYRDINVTPLIDVLLVLIVVFLLMLRIRTLLWVNVPPPVQSARPVNQGPPIVLALREDGTYEINGTPVSRGRLAARLKVLNAHGRRDVLFVQAAPRRRYREVLEAVDIARGAGWRIVGYVP